MGDAELDVAELGVAELDVAELEAEEGETEEETEEGEGEPPFINCAKGVWLGVGMTDPGTVSYPPRCLRVFLFAARPIPFIASPVIRRTLVVSGILV